MHRASAETARRRVCSQSRAAIKLVTIFDRRRRRRRLLIKLVGARLSEADETAGRRPPPGAGYYKVGLVGRSRGRREISFAATGSISSSSCISNGGGGGGGGSEQVRSWHNVPE